MLGEFSGAIAHQMRNPLSNILMGTKRLQKILGLGDWQSAQSQNNADDLVRELLTDRKALDEILADVFSGVYNLNQVVTELLEYTKTLKPRLSLQRIEVVLKDTIQASHTLGTRSDIKVLEDFDALVPSIPVDAVLIGQAFQNVIHNAIQAMPQGGHLLFSTGVFEERPGNVLISVSDSGIGIAEAEIEKVFRPFHTTKENGVGLGLSLSHRIIEAHGGAIWACRNPCDHLARGPESFDPAEELSNSGTTVHMALPITSQGSGHGGAGETK